VVPLVRVSSWLCNVAFFRLVFRGASNKDLFGLRPLFGDDYALSTTSSIKGIIVKPPPHTLPLMGTLMVETLLLWSNCNSLRASFPC
jgi:hypothetical protein